MMPTARACGSCGAENGHFYDCPIGGLQQPMVASAPVRLESDGGDELERALLFALPIALVAMFLINLTDFGGALVRIVFAMWLHESGHTLAAWFCGSFAVPLPWVTMGGNERSVVFIALELAVLGFWGFKRRDHLKFIIPLGVALLVGLVLSPNAMGALVVFSGDGGALVLGTLFMASVFLPSTVRLARGGLRWGFLVIGAGSFANVFVQWWRAWRDPAQIPFGRIEGVGLSDPTRLVDNHGWAEHRVVMSYLVLGGLCLLALAALWAWRFFAQRRGA